MCVHECVIKHHQIFGVLLTSTVVTAKFWDESKKIVNKEIAQLCRVPQLNKLELAFLYGMDFSFCVESEVLDAYMDMLVNLSSSYEQQTEVVLCETIDCGLNSSDILPLESPANISVEVEA
eukprot:TRINITY_DN10749_c0_g1_i1.p1 TRINITY_DN10749_c0_g1~~TRINITY_DN10749_c0_g1_i1.p1  ORF type:complete len:121 (-),score=16.07 TRINITY_DN10749_c0_g1_i1:52-414(-)